MAYNSKLGTSKYNEVAGLPLCPLKTEVKGPAPKLTVDDDDIIDEAIKLYRVNVLMKNFPIKSNCRH